MFTFSEMVVFLSLAFAFFIGIIFAWFWKHTGSLDQVKPITILQQELTKLTKELTFYKHQSQVGEMKRSVSDEYGLVDTLISALLDKDDVAAASRSFLEVNTDVEVCQRMLETWESLKPSTHKVLALVSQVTVLQNENVRLRNNLTIAEDKVKLLFEENNAPDKEKTRLMTLLENEKQLNDSWEKHNCASIKGTGGWQSKQQQEKASREVKLVNDKMKILEQKLDEMMRLRETQRQEVTVHDRKQSEWKQHTKWLQREVNKAAAATTVDDNRSRRQRETVQADRLKPKRLLQHILCWKM